MTTRFFFVSLLLFVVGRGGEAVNGWTLVVRLFFSLTMTLLLVLLEATALLLLLVVATFRVRIFPKPGKTGASCCIGSGEFAVVSGGVVACASVGAASVGKESFCGGNGNDNKSLTVRDDLVASAVDRATDAAVDCAAIVVVVRDGAVATIIRLGGTTWLLLW